MLTLRKVERIIGPTVKQFNRSEVHVKNFLSDLIHTDRERTHARVRVNTPGIPAKETNIKLGY